jgi:AraC-like DNA-binding protein
MLDKRYQQEKDSQGAAEDISFRQTTMPLSVDTVLHVVSQALDVEPEDFLQRRRNSPIRAVAADFLLRYAKLTQRQVADHLRMGTGVAVSKQLNRWRDRIAKDHVLQRQLKAADRLLEEKRAFSVKY